MMRFAGNVLPRVLILAFAAAFAGESVGSAGAMAASPPAGAAPSYPAMADLAVAAPIVARVRIRSVTPLDPGRYPASRPGDFRVLVVADTLNLIRGESGLASRISFLADAPREAGPRPKWKKQEMLVFGRPSARLDEMQLLGRDAMLAWSPARDALARRIVQELLAPDAPPTITGVDSAFHVAGTIAGESETQFFLGTTKDKPVSLSVLRRPGMPALFGVALGEVVDEAAALPTPDTLLWYRLACALPEHLPEPAVTDLTAQDAAAARSDYAAFIAALGRCSRMAS